MSTATILDTADEQLVIAEIQKGNREAWAYIAKKYQSPLFAFILGMVHERETAEELVQDVLVNFWMKREQIFITTSLKAYLYKASRNHTLNFLKRKKFEQDYQRRLAQEMVLQRNETEDEYVFSELHKKLNDAIDGLPESSREIFKMSRFSEMTYKEIAEALDIPVRTVHYQIGLALKELRSKLGHLLDVERF